MSENNEIKFYYYDANGYGMISRAILFSVKEKFDNIKVSLNEWETLKKSEKFEYQNLPCLEYKGKYYSQAHSIELFLGKTYNLYGNSIEDEYQINSMLDTFDDLYNIYKHIYMPLNDEDKEHLDDYKRAMINKIEYFMNIFDNKYIKYGEKKYFLGENFSVADIFLTCVITLYCDKLNCKNLLEEKFPKLFKIINNVKKNELKEFFQNAYNNESNY